MRGDVLAALGVLKVATADHIWQLMCPGTKDNKPVRNACLDLQRHKLVLSEGSTADGHKLWGLTLLGLDAAEALGRPLTEMGAIARGAARSGAKHAIRVNEAIIGFTQTPPRPTRPVVPPARHTGDQGLADTGAAARPEGIGTIHAWATEAQHNLPSAGRNRTGAQADAVLQAPEAGVPVLIVEVDNGTESPGVLVAKFAKYLRFFQLQTKDATGTEYPVWRTMYAPTGREGYPPIAVVFNGRMSTDALHARMEQVKELSREYWQGRYHAPFDFYGKPAIDGYWDHSNAIPIIATTLNDLAQRGPHAPIWWRYGRAEWEPILTALANPDDQDAYRLSGCF